MFEIKYRIEIASERALIVYFDNELSPKLSAKIKQFDDILKGKGQSVIVHAGANLITESIPSYASVLVMFEPLTTDYFSVKSFLQQVLISLQNDTDITTFSRKTIELPVYYDESVGPDLALIAKNASLSIQDVIELHQSIEYQVFAIGFAPGFGYLGNVDSRIATPRLATPRAVVPKGAVAIADQQTAVYPASSPGGWNIIGRCPVNMFDANSEPNMPFTVGDLVKFIAIDKSQFLSLGGEL